MSKLKIAIYEPSPRVCGPDSWADALRWGFRELGHQCDVVAFTKSGRQRSHWGSINVERSNSSSSCKLTVDVCEKPYRAKELLNRYDLIVLTDVKTAPADNDALKNDTLPDYVKILSQVETPWTSALHGKLYYEPHETPNGWREKSGSFFIDDLLSLPNFTGVLAQHARDYDKHCAVIRERAPRRIEFPLPYRLQIATGTLAPLQRPYRFGTCGRMNPNKCHLAVACAIADAGYNDRCIFRGISSVTVGPAYTLTLFEDLLALGFTGSRDGEGKKSARPFFARKNDAVIEYQRAYNGVLDGFSDIDIHVAITDSEFSGGLLEFATLEAIDCGCLPVVTRPFDPHYTALPDLQVIDVALTRVGIKWARNLDARDELKREFVKTVDPIYGMPSWWRLERVKANREAIRTQHDPKRLAQRFIEECL